MLPPEILLEIISHTFRLRTNRIALLLTCSEMYTVAIEFVYRNLRFNSRAQLESFLDIYQRKPCKILIPPCCIELELANDIFYNLYADISSLLAMCRSVKGVSLDEKGRLALDLLNLKCDSYGSAEELPVIQECMDQVNPRSFTWVGTDPPHHFSIAIMPTVTKLLVGALEGFSRLTHLKLTHISFASTYSTQSSLPEIPSLKTLYIGQAVFFPVESVAHITALSKAMPNLEEVRLVDAYHESIWGFRVRRTDVERAAEGLACLLPECSPGAEANGLEHIPPVVAAEAAAKKICQIVICEARTERLMGGDRVGPDSILI